ncbi:hypothetical protein DPEC_G00144800, partial [Dallia pectoralis]
RDLGFCCVCFLPLVGSGIVSRVPDQIFCAPAWDYQSTHLDLISPSKGIWSLSSLHTVYSPGSPESSPGHGETGTLLESTDLHLHSPGSTNRTSLDLIFN